MRRITEPEYVGGCRNIARGGLGAPAGPGGPAAPRTARPAGLHRLGGAPAVAWFGRLPGRLADRAGLPFAEPSRIAVLLHAFYAELVPELLGALKPSRWSST